MPAIPEPSGPSPLLGAVVALKRSTMAKSRLGELPVPLRQRLAEAMAWDTLQTLDQVVDRLVVVSDDPNLAGTLARLEIPAAVLPEPAPAGMNAALRLGAESLQAQGCRWVLACVGDLPALTVPAVQAVAAVLAEQAGPGRLYVPDHTGIGTTVLIADRVPLDPHFQGGSAAAHRTAGAVAITGLGFPGLHHDVDSPEDLAAVAGLGVGPHTAALLDPESRRPADYQAITVAQSASEAEGLSVITDAGTRLRLPVRALDPRLRLVRPGQRLHAVTAGGRVLSAWL